MGHHLHLEILRVIFKDLLLLCFHIDDLSTATSFFFNELEPDPCDDDFSSLVCGLSFCRPSYEADLLTVIFVSKLSLVAGISSLTDTVCVEESFVIQETIGREGDMDDLGLLVLQLLNESSIDSETDHVD